MHSHVAELSSSKKVVLFGFEDMMIAAANQMILWYQRGYNNQARNNSNQQNNRQRSLGFSRERCIANFKACQIFIRKYKLRSSLAPCERQQQQCNATSKNNDETT
jgi:hypothetical protein